jgi:hypothetical protein
VAKFTAGAPDTLIREVYFLAAQSLAATLQELLVFGAVVAFTNSGE